MSEFDNLKNEIKGWFAEDDVKASEITIGSADFQLVLSNAFGLGLEIDIAKPKSKSIIVFGTKLQNPPAVQQGFLLIGDVEKIRTIEELKRDLIRLGVEYRISDNFSTVMIVKELYLQDMTRTTFMESLKLVRNAAIFVISILSEKLATEQTATPPHSHADLTSPYG
jgi:hypothetical protein